MGKVLINQLQLNTASLAAKVITTLEPVHLNMGYTSVCQSQDRDMNTRSGVQSFIIKDNSTEALPVISGKTAEKSSS